MQARRTALASAESRGYGDEAIRVVAATLPGADGRRFVLEALERKAAADGYAALSAAVRLEEPLRSAVLAASSKAAEAAHF